jgi:NAD(P)-dependent dehydrogenase (short-subunit alcohol dehydrogenase family)
MLAMRLQDKVAIITGAAQGIGKAIAETFAQEGAKVVINDVKTNEATQIAIDTGGLSITADVTKEDEVERMIKQTVKHFGTVDILVNNAGILYPTKIDDISKDEWDRVLDVNLKSVFLCTKAVLGIMKEKGSGRIVNMSSSAGRSVSTVGGAHYTTSKAAMLGFTRAVAKEVAPYGITVNAVCPGLIDTEMVRLECSPEQVANYVKNFPISRIGTPEEVAKLVLFLITDADYITGASIDINGGDFMI